MEVDLDRTFLLDIKMRIYEQEGVPPHQQRVIYNGQQMTDQSPLRECGVTDGSTLHLLINLRAPFRRKHGRKGIHIFVKMMTGKTVTLNMPSREATVLDMKQQIASSQGIATFQQRLVFRGRAMEDQRTLMYCNIQNEDTLYLVLKLKSFKVLVTGQVSRSSIILNMSGMDTVLDLKKEIEDREDIPVGQQRLFFAGQLLDDDLCTLRDYHIESGNTVCVRLTEGTFGHSSGGGKKGGKGPGYGDQRACRKK